MKMTFDEKNIISGGEDKTIFIWDIDSYPDNTRTNLAHKSPISAIEVSRFGDQIISASWDRTIKLWRFSDFQLLGIFEGHTDIIRTIALSPSGKILASSGRDKGIRVWDLTVMKQIDYFHNSDSTVLSLKFSKYGDLLIAADVGKRISIWNMNKRKLKKVIEAHADSITSLSLFSDGHAFISGSMDKSLKVWNLEKDSDMHLLESNKEEIIVIAAFPDSTRAISCGIDNIIHLWNLFEGSQISTSCIETATLSTLSISPDGKYVVYGDVEGYLSVLCIENNNDLIRISREKIHSAKVSFVKFHTTSNSLISVSEDKTIKISSIDLKNSFFSLDLNPGVITAFEIGFNGEYILIAYKENFKILGWEYKSFKNTIDFQGHKNEITSLKCAENSMKLISSSLDCTVKIWNMRKMNLEQTINTLRKILCMELTKDEYTIITTHGDCSLRLWDIDTQEQMGRTANYPTPIKILTLTPDSSILLSAAGFTNQLKKIYLNKIKSKYIKIDHKKGINSIALSPDNNFLAAGSDDFDISLWEVKGVKLKVKLHGHTKKVNSVNFSPDSNFLVSGSLDHTIRVWDLSNFKHRIIKCESVLEIVLFDNGKKLLAGCHDKTVRVFDLLNIEQKKPIAYFDHDSRVKRVIVDNSGSKAYSADEENIYQFDLDKLIELKSVDSHCTILAMTISSDDTTLFTSYDGNDEIHLWGVETGNFVKKNIVLYGRSKTYFIIVDNKLEKLYAAANDNKIYVWDLKNKKIISDFEGHDSKVTCLALSSDENTLFSCSDDRSVRAWQLKDCRKIPFLDGHNSKINRLAISPNGKYLASGDDNDTIIVWDLSTNKLKHSLTNEEENCSINGLAITTDGKRIVATTTNPKKSVWDLEEGTRIKQFQSKQRTALSQKLVLTPDNKNAIIAYSDSIIRSWNLENSSTEEVLFEGHSGTINDLVVSKDGKKLISGGDDNLIIIWNIENQKQIQSLIEHEEDITALELSPDNSLLISAGNDKKIIIWNFVNFQIIKIIQGISSFKYPISDIRITPDNERLFVAYCHSENEPEINRKIKKKNIYAYSLKNYENLPLFDQEIKGCGSMIISPDLKNIITCEDKTIHFWDYNNCNYIMSLSGYVTELTAETMSYNKQMIILADEDNKITVWDLILKRKVAQLEGHTQMINSLIATSKNQIISASDDKLIGIWSISDAKLICFLESHLAEVTSIAISQDEKLLVSSSDGCGIILWDLDLRVQIRRFSSNEKCINAIFILPSNKHFLTAGEDKILKKWNLEDESQTAETLANFPFTVKKLIFSPDMKILLVFLDMIATIQIWDASNFTLISQVKHKNLKSTPGFLSNYYNRLLFFEDKIIDCLTGRTIFKFIANEEISSYFYDFENNNYFYISKYFKMYQLNPNFLSDYLYNYINFDSILNMPKDVDEICENKTSIFPYFFNFLHLICIYDNSKMFTIEKLKIKYENDEVDFISNFYSLDIFLNTPLDILIQRKNTSLIVQYFTMFEEAMTDKVKKPSFYQKARFFSYEFREGYSIANLFCELIPLLGEDLSPITKMLNFAFLDYTSDIYDNSLFFKELDDPILIQSKTMFINKSFIKDELIKMFPDDENSGSKNQVEQDNQAKIKAKLLSLPWICDLSLSQTKKFYEIISNMDSANEIFKNKTFSLMVNFIWNDSIQFYYIMEFVVFAFFFIIFNVNFAILFNSRTSIIEDNMDMVIIDILLFSYSIFTFFNEVRQLYQNWNNYFKYIWNYVDIALIPLLMGSSLCDFSLFFIDYGDNIRYLKLLFSICMGFIWLRLLSFTRGVKETSSMIRLILNVISSIKSFVLFMVLFMLTLSSALYILREESDDDTTSTSFVNTFLVFYSTAVGDTSGISAYNLVFPDLEELFMILATFLFAIMSMNLLVSIIGDKHSENNENEENTRVFELLNICIDTDSSLVTQIMKFFRKPKPMERFLIKIYNEKHEANSGDSDPLLEIRNRVENLQKTIVDDKQEQIKYDKKMQKFFESNNQNILTKIENIHKDNENNKNVLNEIKEYIMKNQVKV